MLRNLVWNELEDYLFPICPGFPDIEGKPASCAIRAIPWAGPPDVTTAYAPDKEFTEELTLVSKQHPRNLKKSEPKKAFAKWEIIPGTDAALEINLNSVQAGKSACRLRLLPLPSQRGSSNESPVLAPSEIHTIASSSPLLRAAQVVQDPQEWPAWGAEVKQCFLPSSLRQQWSRIHCWTLPGPGEVMLGVSSCLHENKQEYEGIRAVQGNDIFIN